GHFVESADDFPAQAEVQCQFAADLPIVLNVEAVIAPAVAEVARIDAAAGTRIRPEQEAGETVARLVRETGLRRLVRREVKGARAGFRPHIVIIEAVLRS